MENVKNIRDFNHFAFYGSLRRNMYNNHWWLAGGATYLNEVRLYGFRMFSLGAYPMIMKSDNMNDSITVELYKIDNFEVKDRIHKMELGAGYSAGILEIEGIEFVIYYFDKYHYTANLEKIVVPSGDWVKHLQKEQ